MSTPAPAPALHWTGASGEKYAYWSHALPVSFSSGQDGNYIFAKIVNNVWVPIYIGQGDLHDRVNDPTHYTCATGKGATHVHAHTTATEAARIAEERDLLAGYSQAYAPTGCNQKLGG